ncbi:Spb1 C-terminal domain-containing protein [Xylaria sp. FL1042]|nr:Spb1 C-terminal domain-containing protein [Xylaria sp. FL1042]
MGFQKKTGKGRLDKYYRLAKEKGYRARAAFKLLQLNKKFGFLQNSRVCIDLCAAPGSWCQVAAEAMPKGSLIVGVDLSPIKPIPGVISFQSDITSDKCRAELRRHLKTWKADTVLHDGAPNVGTAWIQDSFNQAELTLMSLKLAVEFLGEGGTFCTKVFRSAQYNQLLWIFGQLFDKVEATKPPSSRNVSAEIFCVCRGFKAPKNLDPRFLDPRTAFADLNETVNTDEARVYKPELKKRKRGGYEEGDYTLYKEVLASEFVESTDPISILANTNRLVLETLEPSLSLAALNKMPATTPEIRQYCSDLKVLGRSEFKKILKWRLMAREAFGLPTKKTSHQPAVAEEEVAEVESMDEELRIQEDLQAMKDKVASKRKREKRKENERKTKEIQRLQMHMTAPMDLGIESASGQEGMFQLKALEKDKVVSKIAKGRMAVLTERTKKDQDSGIGSSGDTDDESDDMNDGLEQQLDQQWDTYQERRRNYEARLKRRKQEEDGDWEGVSADEQESSDDDIVEESDESDDDEDDKAPQQLLTDLDGTKEDPGLSKRASKFFNQDIFKDIPGLEQSDSDSTAGGDDEDMADAPVTGKFVAEPTVSEKTSKTVSKRNAKKQPQPVIEDETDEKDQNDEDDGWKDDHRRSDGRPNIDIITAEAMMLAQQLATKQKTKHDLIEENFDRYAFRDRDGLPEWFLEDEGKHEKKQKPISKEAAQAIKEKTRALNARPIKKVREAQARKKFKAAQRLEKLKKKSDLLVNEEGMTEKEKAEGIAKLIGKAKKKAPKRSVKVVVAKGVNRGIQGRPKGVKGRYKIVDSRMKKEMRALKRISKRKSR